VGGSEAFYRPDVEQGRGLVPPREAHLQGTGPFSALARSRNGPADAEQNQFGARPEGGSGFLSRCGPAASWIRVDPALAGTLERASRAIARLDQALDGHPLLPAFLYRSRLEAVRRQAAVDGQLIDPWHLAAVLEGFRLRMDHTARIIDRGDIFDAARHALALHQWLTVPDFDQEGEVKQAEAVLASPEASLSPLLSVALGMRTWLDRDGTRPPLRAALVRYWTRHRLFRSPVPLTGATALRAEAPWAVDAWVPEFLTALAGEADDGRQLLLDMERAWFDARRAVAGRRINSRAAIAIDLMAAAPLISAPSLAAGLGMALKNGLELMDGFCAEGIAIEVTHRSKRRLFGLAGLAPLREEVSPPRRPEPGRGRGRPPASRIEADPVSPLPPPERLLTPIERRSIDYSELEGAITHLELKIRDTRRALDALARREPVPVSVCR
jgi:hypothetical protein